MEFRILGGLEAESGGKHLSLGGPSEQKVLAVLLLNAGRVVPVTHLVDTLWDDGPPATAVKQVRNAVGRLRRALAAGHPAAVIDTESTGYRMHLAEGALDAHRFDAKASQAEDAAAAGQTQAAAALTHSALGLWRGPALAGLTGQVIEGAAAYWDERRCAAQERHFDLRLALGEHQHITSDLLALAAAHPLRERLVAQLMLALYRCGRQADALRAYDAARALLAEELGIDPGPQLQELQLRILGSDPALDLPAAAGPGAAGPGGQGAGDSGPGRPVPQQLPAAAPHFTGRAAELTLLNSLLDQAPEPGGMVLISAIGGTAGIGKTAVAVHWAHQTANRFPDGQLYVNLRGFGPSGTPMAPAEAVRGFLDALGVPAERVPASLEEQAALYRSELAGRRMLVVLDNARDAAQVRPLLPGAPGCLAIVTSRSQLAGLIATGGALPISLDLLTRAEAHELLASRLGAERLAAEPGPAAELIGLSARLPLALSIAAARAATRPGLPLAALAAELRDVRDRLDALDVGDDASVRAAFSWSYGQLPDRAARMFRLLGVHPGPDISAAAAASLAGASRRDTRHALRELTGANLVTEHAPGRFTFHDLLRAYAEEQADAGESEAERHAATARLLDHYLHTGHAAALLLHPARPPIALGPRRPGVVPEDLSGYAGALAWFEAEYRVLLAAVAQAGAAGFHQHAWQLPWTLSNFLDRHGQWQDWSRIQRTALAAAGAAGDHAGQAHAHCLLGRAEVRLGNYAEGDAHLRQALRLFGELGDAIACARAHLDLGWLRTEQDRHGEALGHIERALGLFQGIGDRAGEALTLSNLGWHYSMLGEHQRAIDCCQQGLALHQAHGNLVGQAETLDSLGYAHHHLGEYRQALVYYERALGLCRELAARHREAAMLDHLGDTHAATGNTLAARDAWRQALAILGHLGHAGAEGVRGKLNTLSGCG